MRDRLTLAAHLFVLVACGCNQPPPPGSDTSDTGEIPTNSGSLYPLVDGATWTYRVTNISGQLQTLRTVSATPTTWEGGSAWDLTEQDMGWASVSTIIQAGDLYMRVHRVESAEQVTTGIYDYDPGFVRWNEGWTMVGPAVEYFYDRTANENGQIDVESRGHLFEVLAVDEIISVPAGSFGNCVVVQRTRTVGAETGVVVQFSFCPGVGIVREIRPVEEQVLELMSVSIPGGAQYP